MAAEPAVAIRAVAGLASVRPTLLAKVAVGVAIPALAQRLLLHRAAAKLPACPESRAVGGDASSLPTGDSTLPPGATLTSGSAPPSIFNTIDNPWGVNQTGVQGGGDALTALQGGAPSASLPSNLAQGTGDLNATSGANVLGTPPTGQSAAPGLPGVGGPGDLTSAQPQQKLAGTGTPDANQSVLKSLGISNPLGAAVGAAGLGFNLAQGQKPPAFTPQMQAQADALTAQGKQLMSYLQSGSLPPGLKAGLDQATAAAKAKIISNFASQGLNTDPNQNSALASQLAQVDQQALISTAQIGQQLLSTGITETGLSSDLYKTLAQIDATQTANIGKAIANFAQALSGSGGGTTIKLGG